jgi:hypothetical protein
MINKSFPYPSRKILNLSIIQNQIMQFFHFQKPDEVIFPFSSTIISKSFPYSSPKNIKPFCYSKLK